MSAAAPAAGGEEVPAKLVMQLRAATGLPMMKCKEALLACGNDYEKSVDWLRKKGLETAAKKADRVMKEGRVAIQTSPDGSSAAMVEVDCETEPVMNSPDFKGLVDGICSLVISKAKGHAGELPIEQVLAWPHGKGETVDSTVKHLVAKIGENMAMRRAAAFSGAQRIGTYLHFNAKVGVVTELSGDAKALGSPDAKAFIDDLGKHVAFAKPVALSRTDVSADLVAKEMEIYREQAKQDPKMAGKPPQVVEQILKGRLDKYFADKCLVDQPWVMDDKMKVKDALDAAAKRAGGAFAIKRFAIFQVGA